MHLDGPVRAEMQLDFSDIGIWLSHWSFSFPPARTILRPIMPKEPSSPTNRGKRPKAKAMPVIAQPPSPSSDELGLPLTPRPTLANIGKVNTEQDLWTLDEEGPGLTPSVSPGAESKDPLQRSLEVEKLPKESAAADLKHPRKVDKLSVIPSRHQSKSSGQPIVKVPSTVGIEFDDLDHWDDDDITEPKSEEIEEVREISTSADLPKPELESISPTPASAQPDEPELGEVDEVAESKPEAEAMPPPAMPTKEVLQTLAKPITSMSKLERFGLIGLFIVLILGGGGFLLFSIYGLPTESKRVMENDFPIKGEHLEIKSASTYWRAPITTGDNPDKFQRGTVFLPAIKFAANTGNGALRVVFRNQDGELVGDVQTRMINAGESLEIPATAGFDDAGMHAAYRTGESKPWTVQVSEAPSTNSPPEAFKELFQINISTDRY